MSKTAVIYWSGTGNTEAMAMAIGDGAGADVFSVDRFKGKLEDYDRVAFGCPSMGDEVLEEGEFDPFFTGIEVSLAGKKVALFGSYGWGDGQWMRDWEERTKAAGAAFFKEGFIINETPDADGLASCNAFGKEFAAF